MDTIFKKIVVVLFIFIFPSVVYAQSSGVGQQIIGTWTDQENNRWIFNSNGTFSVQDEDSTETGKYGLAGSRIVLIMDADIEDIMELFFSPDGRTMFMVTSDYDECFILTKK